MSEHYKSGLKILSDALGRLRELRASLGRNYDNPMFSWETGQCVSAEKVRDWADELDKPILDIEAVYRDWAMDEAAMKKYPGQDYFHSANANIRNAEVRHAVKKAFDLIACGNTVTILSLDEMREVVLRELGAKHGE